MQKFSHATAQLIGHPHTFIVNILVILLWATSGPLFKFSDTWQLIVNTGTTVFTYLMLFVLQNSQNRGEKALHDKLNTLIQAIPKADDTLIGCENPENDSKKAPE